MECWHFGTNGRNSGTLPSWDTKMSLESSNRRRSKILTAAMDTNEDYKKFRTKLEKGIKSAAGKVVGSPKAGDCDGWFKQRWTYPR